ncbi:TPA: hypothetical protein ACLBZ7_006143, partial [Bacillus cereus]
ICVKFPLCQQSFPITAPETSITPTLAVKANNAAPASGKNTVDQLTIASCSVFPHHAKLSYVHVDL